MIAKVICKFDYLFLFHSILVSFRLEISDQLLGCRKEEAGLILVWRKAISNLKRLASPTMANASNRVGKNVFMSG